MPRNPPTPRSGLRVAAIAGVPLLLVAYVLSIGPAARLGGARGSSPELYLRIYAPVFWVTKRNDTAKSVVVWWLLLWLPGNRSNRVNATTHDSASFPRSAEISRCGRFTLRVNQ